MRQVFPFSDTIRPYGPIILGVTLLLYVVLALPIILLAPTERNLSLILLITLICLPFDLLGLYLTVRHIGRVILTDESIILQRWGREQRLPYSEITAFRPRDRHIPPNLIFQSPHTTLKFSRMLENFPQFYAVLEQRIPTLINATLGSITLPWKLQVTRGFWVSHAFFMLLFLLVGGLISFGVSYDTTKQTFNSSVFWLTLLVGSGLLSAALLGELAPSQPWQLRFSTQSIEARYLGT